MKFLQSLEEYLGTNHFFSLERNFGSVQNQRVLI